MLIAAKRICGCTIEGVDGSVGTIQDLLFHGGTWSICYLDVDTGRWLPGRRVILSPQSIGAADYPAQVLRTPLSKEQVKNSPPLETELPVSRQKQIELERYYAWGTYWADMEADRKEAGNEGDPDLRSTEAVSGYRILASNGEIGHVSDFIVDDEPADAGQWPIRYLVVDTGNWLPGEQVLIPPTWAESIDWDTRRVAVALSKESIEKSPRYDPEAPVNRKYEEVFYDYYGRARYWTGTGHCV